MVSISPVPKLEPGPVSYCQFPSGAVPDGPLKSSLKIVDQPGGGAGTARGEAVSRAALAGVTAEAAPGRAACGATAAALAGPDPASAAGAAASTKAGAAAAPSTSSRPREQRPRGPPRPFRNEPITTTASIPCALRGYYKESFLFVSVRYSGGPRPSTGSVTPRTPCVTPCANLPLPAPAARS